MRPTRLALTLAALFALGRIAPAAAQPTDLFLSEYVEGSSNNKAIEIYNGTGGAIDLAAGDYIVQIYFNGSTTPTTNLTLGGTVDAGAVHVVTHSSATAALLALADQNSSSLSFNGNDAVVLRKGGTGGAILDSIGQVGFDPGTAWGTAPDVTVNATLRRDASICAGDADVSDAYDPASEWTGSAQDTFSGLGAHSATCTTTPTLSIADAAILEGDAGTSNLVFTVTVSPAPAGVVSFDIATQDGTATDADNDYEPASLTGQQIVPPATGYQFTVQVNGDATAEPTETFSVVVSNLSGADAGDLTATGTLTNDEIVLTPIHSIQGGGAASPLAGQLVTTRGIVTGVKSNGFFLQARDDDADADPATSEGVQVFTGSAPPAGAAVGNEVQVAGTVAEYVPSADPQQPPLTEIGGTVTVDLISTGNLLPVPIPLIATLPDPAQAFDQLERLEGMRVSVASLTVGGPTLGSLTEATGATSSSGVFYGVVTGVPRALREAGVQLPDDLAVLLGGAPPANVPRFDTNPERIRVDADGLVGGSLLDVRAGQTVAGLIGPLDYSFRTYTVLPDAGAVLVPSGAIAPVAAALPAAGELTVASYNLERFFDDVDDPLVGEPVLANAWYEARLAKASVHVRDFLHAPDILGIVEMENLATLQALAARISTDAVAAAQPDPQYAAYLLEGNDIGGIDVGFLVKTGLALGSVPRVEVVDVVQEGKTTTWIDPGTGAPALLNDRPPLRLRARVNHPNGSDFPVTVIVVHQRSLNGIASTAPTGSTTTGNRVRQKRRAQSEYLANLLQARQSADSGERIVVVGDFNAFEDNDGFVDVMGTVQGAPAPADQVALASSDLVEPDFARLADADDYSFVFDGNAQNLDHAIVDAALVAATTARRLDHARVNADFAEVDRATLDARLADHDPLVAYLEVGSFADPDAIFRDDFERGTAARWSALQPPPGP